MNAEHRNRCYGIKSFLHPAGNRLAVDQVFNLENVYELLLPCLVFCFIVPGTLSEHD